MEMQVALMLDKTRLVDKYGCLPLRDWDCTELDMEQLDQATRL